MVIVGLALLKFFLYYGVCLLAPRVLRLAVPDQTAFALKWAAIRVAVGIALAYPLFLVVAYAQEIGVPFTVAYLSALSVSRCLLWYVIGRAINSGSLEAASAGGTAAWVTIGVAASFAVDGLAYFAGAEHFKFVC